MDKPISVGDLVQVVRDCCGLHLGATFIVGDIDSSAGTWQCRACRGLGRTVCAVNYDDSYGSLGPYFPLAWLKRIPPLEELEDEKRDEEVTA